VAFIYLINKFPILSINLDIRESQVFNFFEEIKKSVGSIDPNILNTYNIINISGKILYVEGHMGLTMLSKEMIAFKVKRGRVMVEGKELVMYELTENTMKIVGQISKVEVL